MTLIPLYPYKWAHCAVQYQEYRGIICTKFRETIKKCIMYIHNQQPKENNSARQTMTRHLNSNIPKHPHWKNSKTVSCDSLHKHTNHTANVIQYTHMRKRCVFSLDFKDDKDEQRRIFKGNNSKHLCWKFRSTCSFSPCLSVRLSVLIWLVINFPQFFSIWCNVSDSCFGW